MPKAPPRMDGCVWKTECNCPILHFFAQVFYLACASATSSASESAAAAAAASSTCRAGTRANAAGIADAAAGAGWCARNRSAAAARAAAAAGVAWDQDISGGICWVVCGGLAGAGGSAYGVYIPEASSILRCEKSFCSPVTTNRSNGRNSTI